MIDSTFRSGFVSIIGSPNAGKSTLLNRVVGQKVSIVSPKAQTTRNRIMGVATRPEYQIVFLDTPGVAAPKNRLGEYMLKVAYESLNEVECVLFMADAANGIRERDEAIIAKLREAKAPIIAAINKCDIAEKNAVDTAKKRLEKESCFKNIFEISAETGAGVDALEAAIANYLVPGPMYFPEDMVTDMPERVVCAEIIREKALNLLKDEVPHGIGVGIDKMVLRPNGDLYDMWATIYCEREGHKGIIIGKKGSMLKQIGSEARKDMEWMLGTRVNLQLWVKVRDDWRNSPGALKELGYE
jgi:GTPase